MKTINYIKNIIGRMNIINIKILLFLLFIPIWLNVWLDITHWVDNNTLWNSSSTSSKTINQNEVIMKVLISWYTYISEEKTWWLVIYIEDIKTHKILWYSTSTLSLKKLWYYDIVIDIPKSVEEVNICLKWKQDYSHIKFCNPLKTFQKVWRQIQWVEIREITSDIYTNWKWDNLSQIYHNTTIKNQFEDEINEYYDTINLNYEKKLEEEAIQKQEEEFNNLKDKYQIHEGSYLKKPLTEIRLWWIIREVSDDNNSLNNIINSSKNELNSSSNNNNNNKENNTQKLDYERTIVKLFNHEGVLIKEQSLWPTFKYKFIFSSPSWKPFLHPLILKVENQQFQKIDGEYKTIYQPEYRLITQHKSLINIDLKKRKLENEIELIKKPEHFPLLEILLIIWFLYLLVVTHIKNRLYKLRYDY